MAADTASLAVQVLDRNRRGPWTCPAADVYPHQWLWDSCFVAIGLARVDPGRAATEVISVLRGQWTNGMVPHMIFAPDVDDVGSRRLWQSRDDPRAPRDVDTSCITQPPVLTIAAAFVARRLEASDRDSFLQTVVPKLVGYHQWLYRERDPARTGLVTLIHPWECGLDTTPPWMTALRDIRQPRWLSLALRLHLAGVARRFRRDVRYIPAAERVTDDDGLRMLALAGHLKRHRFDLANLKPGDSVLIQDVSFNALLVVANGMLLELAEQTGTTLPPELAHAFEAATVAFEGLWDEARGRYCSRDMTGGALITTPTIATFVALWATSQPDRVRRLLDAMDSPAWKTPFPVPSVPTDSVGFNAERYWQGPTWINTNWLIVQGLHAHGETQRAEDLTLRTLDLVATGDFSEYFSPVTGAGYGANGFSWTAALTLDLLHAHDT